jgi:beta-glucanase (GH16 family)
MIQKLFQLILALAVIQLCGCSRHLNVTKDVLIWEENFNQTGSFDVTKWSKIPRGTADWNRYMSDFDSCYAMRDGKLILRGIRNTSLLRDTAPYLTGGVYTKGKMNVKFGRIEVRAKLNGAKGAWPAFWMLAEDAKWPDGGELDIMERLSFDTFAYQTIHTYYTYTLKIKDYPKPSGTGSINPVDFNTYAVEKYPDSIVFFINGKKTFTYPRIQTDKEGQFPFDKHNHYLLIDMQLGGNWVGTVEPSHLPVEMEIDWVRFYKFRNLNHD